MRHGSLKRELELLLLLTQNRQFTPDDLCQRFDISRRTLYYYLDSFREAGLNVDKNGRYYFISRDSLYFQQLFELLEFSEADARLVHQLIADSPAKSIAMKALDEKLVTHYDIATDDVAAQAVSRNFTRINEAMRKHRMARIVSYSSNNSRTTSDRIVEPFLFMNNNKDVRCYEPASGVNKTFRISRMGGVEVLNDNWQNADKHRRMFTDLFMFSGEQHYLVELILGQVAHNLMLEEYPLSAPCMAQRDDGRWLFRTEVCSFIGIGRFVLGLLDDIEIVASDDFRHYILDKLQGHISALV